MNEDSTRPLPPRPERLHGAPKPLDALGAGHFPYWKPGSVILGVFEVRQLLGVGGMGCVYRVYHPGWGMDLAAKYPHPESLKEPPVLARFEQECEIWSNLDLHPHTVGCYFVKRFENVPLVFVEYIEGGSLQEWIRTGRLYEGSPDTVLSRILHIATQTASGLQHAHAHGLVHQDVKPANILMTPTGLAKVTDFGLARAQAMSTASVDGGIHRNALVSCGGMTPAYCSPEQRKRQPLNLKSDIWSWAVSVLEMFRGGVTWMLGEAAPEFMKAHLRSSASGEAFVAPIPDSVADLLDACFQKDPDARPGSMREIMAHLADIHTRLLGAPLKEGLSAIIGADDIHAAAASRNNRAVSMIELGRLRDASELLRSIQPIENTEEALSLQEATYNLLLLRARWQSFARLQDLPFAVPEFPDARRQAYLKGMLMLECGELYEAIDTLEKALTETEPYYVDAMNARGIGLLLVGETQPAISSFLEALEKVSYRHDIVRNLALAFYYDGQWHNALQLFERISQNAVFGSDDTIRYATVLAAAGRSDEARVLVRTALNSPDKPSHVLLTAAELMIGSTDFLPGVEPLEPASNERIEWINRVIEKEPRNLRARLDRDTFPRRHGLLRRVHVRDRKRVIPEGCTPSEIAGIVAGSYRALTKRFRWGDVSSSRRRWALVALSGVPPLLVAVLVAAALHACNPTLALVSGSFVFLGAFFLTLQGAPSNDLPRDIVFLLPATALPVLTGAHLFADQQGLGLAPALIVAPIGLLAAFGVWQILLQRLTTFARAFPHRSLSANFRNVPRSIGTKLRRSRLSQEETTRTRPSRAWRLTSNALRDTWALAAKTWIQFKEWQFLLLPQLAAIVILFLVFGIENGIGVYLPFFCVPFALAPVSPRLMLHSNTIMSVGIGVFSGDALLRLIDPVQLGGVSENAQQVPGLLFAGIFLFLNWLAIRRCPDFAPEWTHCRLPDWDIRQMVDPLNIRQYAAPWQLVKLNLSPPSRPRDAEEGRHGRESRPL